MAVDRAIDSTAFDSKLTAVADAIRTAGGTTEPMSFPSGMVEAISVLKSGSEAGGGTISGRKFISGEITFSETPTSEITISHDSPGFYSRAFVFLASRSYAPADNVGALLFACEGSGTYVNSRKYVSLLSSISATIDSMGYTYDTSFTIKSQSATKMLAGKTYIWFRIEK